MSLIASGCNYHPPGLPEAFPTTSLTGQILMAGRPIERGWVTLVPMGGTLGDPVTIPLGPGGIYSTSRAPIGELALRVTLPRSEIQLLQTINPVLAKLLHTFSRPSTPLRGRTADGTPTRLDLDLALPFPTDKTS